VSEEVNRKLPAMNTTVQLSTVNPLHRPWVPQYTSSQTDWQTDRQHYDDNSQSYCV